MNRKQITKRLLALLLVGVIGTSLTQGVGTAMASDNTTLVEVEKSLLEEDFNNTEDVTEWWDNHSGNTSHGGRVYTQEVDTGDNAMQLTGNKVLKLASWAGGAAVARIREDIDVSNLTKLTIKFDYKNNDSGHSSDATKQLYLLDDGRSVNNNLPSGTVVNNAFWSGFNDTGEWKTEIVELEVASGETEGSMNLTYNGKTITTSSDGVLHLNFVAYVSAGAYALVDNVEITGVEKVEELVTDFEDSELGAVSEDDPDWSIRSYYTDNSKIARRSEPQVVDITENDVVNRVTKLTSRNSVSSFPRVGRYIDVTGAEELDVQFDFKTYDANQESTTADNLRKKLYLVVYSEWANALGASTTLSSLPSFWAGRNTTTDWSTVQVKLNITDAGEGARTLTGTAYDVSDGVLTAVDGYNNVAITTGTDGMLYLNFIAYVSNNSSYAMLDNVKIYKGVRKNLLISDFDDCTTVPLTGEGENAWTGYTEKDSTTTVGNQRKNAQTSVATEDVSSWVQKDISVEGLDNIILEYQYKMNKDGNVSLYFGDADATTTDATTPNLMPSTATVDMWYDVRVALQIADTQWNATLYQKSGTAWTSIGTTTVAADANNSIPLCFLTMTDALIDNVHIYTTETYTDGMSGTYTAPTIRDGASVRLVQGESGIRFEGYVNKEYVDTTLIDMEGVESVQYGIVIAPKSYLNEECSDFTVAGLSAKYAENPYLKIEAIKKIDEGDNYKFQCAMIGLSNYATEFAARSYIEILDTNGTVTHVYSDFAETNNVRSIREVAEAALSYTGISYTDVQKAILQDYAAVYVSSTGSDDNNGAASAPYATLGKALESVANDGVIVINDDYTVSDDLASAVATKKVTIKGATSSVVLDFSSVTDNIVNINSPTTFDNIKFTFADGASVFANGHALVIGSGVSSGTSIDLYGGSNGGTVASTSVTVLAGNYKNIFGGGKNGTVTGDTYVYAGGRINRGINGTFSNGTYHIYGGGYEGTVGNTYITLADDARARYLFGGSWGENAVVGTTHVTIAGGTVMSVYGGNDKSSSISATNVTVTGGKMEQLFGANQNASMTGNVVVDLQGGEITRRVYGGCYNNYGFSWSNDYHVTGNIELKISSDVNISLTGTDFAGATCEDLSIYACSRYYKNFSDEVCTITFADQAAYNAYNEKLGANDSTMKNIMSDASPCDTSNASDFIIE